MSKTKREYVENKIQDKVKPETMEWIKNRYLPFLKRQGLSNGTESNRLQALSKLLLIEKIQPENLEDKTEDEVRELGEKVAGNIQANEYVEQGSCFVCGTRGVVFRKCCGCRDCKEQVNQNGKCGVEECPKDHDDLPHGDKHPMEVEQ